jgi:hypothetical protein
MLKKIFAVFLLSLVLIGDALAQDKTLSASAHAGCPDMDMTHGALTTPPPPLVISNSIPFADLMDQSMAIMDQGMAQAPVVGNPDHDFASMMIPHHQGAVDMAKVELLYGKDPALRRLAQEIIVTQGSEIAVMQMSLKQLARNSPDNPPQGHHHE